MIVLGGRQTIVHILGGGGRGRKGGREEDKVKLNQMKGDD